LRGALSRRSLLLDEDLPEQELRVAVPVDRGLDLLEAGVFEMQREELPAVSGEEIAARQVALGEDATALPGIDLQRGVTRLRAVVLSSTCR
jgi:hypothetical protein